MTRRIALASTGPDAVEAGLSVVEQDGNAVDTVIASLAVSMATEPGLVTPMGGAFITVLPPDGAPEVIDANVEMPGRGRPQEAFGQGLHEVYTTYAGGITIYGGYGSVAVPGVFAGLELLHRRHGRMPWAEVLAPAAAVCRNGFRVGAASARYLALTKDNLFDWDEHSYPHTRRVDGTALQTGDLLTNAELADTYDLIGREGARAVYEGDIATALVEACDAHGGLITRADLAAFDAVLRTPLPIPLGEWTAHTNPPPAVGGPMLAVMLGELVAREGRDWSDIIEIQRRVLTYRHHVHDMSRDLEEDGYALLEQVERHGLKGLPTSASTVNVSAVDSDGLAVAITSSAGYGAGATIPGTGLMLNNALGEPELNRLGLHALLPGTRLASNMAPTVARSDDGRTLAIGSPGADRITTALMQVLGRFALMGQGLQESIDGPRLHIRMRDDAPRIEIEDDPQIRAAAEATGLEVTVHPELSMYFGGVGAALLEPDGALQAAGDPRREAATGIR